MLGPGIAPEDVTVTRNSTDVEDVLLTFQGIAGSILIDEQFSTKNYGLESIVFDNGVIWTSLDLANIGFDQAATAGDNQIFGTQVNDIIDGRGGNDHLIGRDGHDTLIGGLGNDRLEGQKHSDTYIYDLGGGDDVIRDNGFTTLFGAHLNDRLILGAGIGTDDALASRTGNDLLLEFVELGGSVTLEDHYLGGQYGLEFIEFNDGAVWTRAQLEAMTATAGNNLLTGTDDANWLDGLDGNDTISGAGGADKLLGGIGDDIIDGGAGIDLLTGGAGNDQFLFKQGTELDTVQDFEVGFDKLDVSDFGFLTFAELAPSISQDGSDTRIDLDADDSLLLLAVQASTLTENDFLFSA